jgi:diguanylate cyclase (GGDEF)-like protein
VRVPARMKATSALMVLILGVLATFGLAVYDYMTNLIASDLGMGAQAVAVAVAHVIEPRMDEYRRIRTEEDQSLPFYRSMREMLRSMKSEDFIRYIYTERRVSEGEIEYILDSEETGSETASPPGSRDAMNALRARAYAERKPVYGPLTDDPVWGRFLTGYAPIVDPVSGDFEGLAGVDIKADTAYALFARLRGVIILLILLLAAASVGPMLKLADFLSAQATIDPLTGAHTRKRLPPDIEKLARKPSSRPPALLMVDLDGFKGLNDSYGREISDRYLSSLARAVRRGVSRREVLYRYDGGKFAVLLPDATKESAFEAAERIRSSAAAHALDLGEGQRLALTVSVGISRWKEGLGAEDLIREADDAMYASKKMGRNRVTDYEDFEADSARARRAKSSTDSP